MTLIIAEAGVNHNGDENIALELVRAAHQSGADIVKFQTFKATKLVTADAKQADYQVANTGKSESQLSMLSRLELSYESHHKLLSECTKLGIEFLSTAFDSESLFFLVQDLGIKRLKIPSGELTNAPLVLEHARTGCEIILSTGMATLAEIEAALSIIAFGYVSDDDAEASIENFDKAYSSKSGQDALRNKVTILHCTTEYPAPANEINLGVMKTLSNAFNLPVGYSDHSAGIHIPIAAAALEATVIEKHFTLDKNMEGPDHKASLEPDELAAMIKGIRDIEIALGSRLKFPTSSEIKNKKIARKSLVAAAEIKKGDLIHSGNLEVKRPGTGISPLRYWDMIGKKATKDYKIGDLLIE